MPASLDTLIAFVLIMLVVSMLITIVVQMVSAALNLRGVNLVMGLTQTFRVVVVAPAEAKDLGRLARLILRGGMLSDSALPKWWILDFWRWASAVRPHEVFDSIHRVATNKKTTDSGLIAAAQNLLTALGVPKEAFLDPVALRAQTSEAAATLQAAIDAIPDPALRALIDEKAQAAKARLQAYADADLERFNAGTASIDLAYTKFQYWYGIAQERVQQWFTTHTRIITIILAVLAAFFLQLDTVEIFSLVSSNRAVREAIVAQSGAIAAQASTALATPSPSPAGSPAPATLSSLQSQYRAVKADFDRDGFDLFPRRAGGRWGNGWARGDREHFLGILFSVGLLSLGAPFWYNVLKGLMSLRSTVAQNISDENDAQQRALATPVAATPPSPSVLIAPGMALGAVGISVPVAAPAAMAPVVLRAPPTMR